MDQQDASLRSPLIPPSTSCSNLVGFLRRLFHACFEIYGRILTEQFRPYCFMHNCKHFFVFSYLKSTQFEKKAFEMQIIFRFFPIIQIGCSKILRIFKKFTELMMTFISC